MNTNQIIRKMNTKGQITLPSSWRSRVGVDTFLIEDNGSSVVIKPAEIISGEEVLFDAKLDSGGAGIPIKDLIKRIEKDLK